MIRLAKLSIRRPKSALAAWLIVGAALSVIGFGVSKSLSPSITVVKGTESARAEKLAGAKFGPSQLVPILLEGPKAQLDRQGPPLVAALTKRAHTRVLSAWDAGSASAGLRPKPTAAMIVVSVDRTESDALKYDQPQIENLVLHTISSPVRPYISGQPSIDGAVRDASLSTLRRDELIAVGILFVLLLIGLRAPIAALVVTATAAVSTLAGFGLVALLGHVIKIDASDVPGGTMVGLAIAVAFSLLILDRFHREQLAPGAEPRTAANATIRELESTGKAVLVAGSAIVLVLLLVTVVGPTELMNSTGTSAFVCSMFAAGGAVVVMPAAFVLLGRRINLFSFPAPAPLARVWARMVSGGNWVTRHAVIAGFVAIALLAAIAVPALGLKTGSSDISQLPSHAKARIAFQEISRVMGPGWATPYSMIVVSNDRPITTPTMLASIAKLQKQIAKNDTVASVDGPGAINPIANQLKSFGPGMKDSVKLTKQSKKDLLKLINGLGQAGSGSNQLRAGLMTAVSGANQLHGGSGQAAAGSVALRNGLVQASSGSVQLEGGLNQALAGANALKAGGQQLMNGASQLSVGISQVQAGAKPSGSALSSLSGETSSTYTAISGAAGQASTASAQISAALSELRSMGAPAKSDPNYASAVGALENASTSAGASANTLGGAKDHANVAKSIAAMVSSQTPALLHGLDQLAGGASQLAAGIEQLRNGNRSLADGISQLAGGGSAAARRPRPADQRRRPARGWARHCSTPALASSRPGWRPPRAAPARSLRASGSMQAAVTKHAARSRRRRISRN